MTIVPNNNTTDKPIKTLDIERALVFHFNPRINTIVPNVSWGFGLSYEIDLLVVSPAKYCTEVEIKISASDIKADIKKDVKAHKSNKVKYFYYAVPHYLVDCEHLPKDCGLLSVKWRGSDLTVETIRPPRLNKNARKLTDEEIIKLNSLASMRMWNLKNDILRLQNQISFMKLRDKEAKDAEKN